MEKIVFDPLLLIGLFAVAVFVLFVGLIVHVIREDREERERRRDQRQRRDRQNEELERQLRDYPWLRDLISRAHRQQETISFDLIVYRTRYGDGVRVEMVRPRNEPRRRVNWIRDGF